MQLATLSPEAPPLTEMLQRARASAPAAPPRSWRAAAMAVACLIVAIGLIYPALLTRRAGQWHTLAWQWNSGTALAAGSGYVAELDIVKLPYGAEEVEDVRHRLKQRYEELLAAGEVQGGLILYTLTHGGRPPTMATLLYGVDEAAAEQLLAAMSEARNVANPRLAQAQVFYQNNLTVPERGGIVLSSGHMQVIEGNYLFFPENTPPAEIATQIEGWYRTKFGKEIEFQISRIGNGFGSHYHEIDPDNPPRVLQPNEITPELKRAHNVVQMSENWELYKEDAPWFATEIPVRPLQSGQRWVKGYAVRIQRYDNATAESIAKLDQHIEEFVRILGQRTETGFNVARFPRELDMRQAPQPGIDLYLPFEDVELIKAIGAEISKRVGEVENDPRTLKIWAGNRIAFLESAAGLSNSEVNLVTELQPSGGSYTLVFPADFSKEQIRDEIAHWEEEWLKLYVDQGGRVLF